MIPRCQTVPEKKGTNSIWKYYILVSTLTAQSLLGNKGERSNQTTRSDTTPYRLLKNISLISHKCGVCVLRCHRNYFLRNWFSKLCCVKVQMTFSTDRVHWACIYKASLSKPVGKIKLTIDIPYIAATYFRCITTQRNSYHKSQVTLRWTQRNPHSCSSQSTDSSIPWPACSSTC